MILKTKGSGRRATLFRLAYVYLVWRMKVSDIYFIVFKYHTKIQYHEINLVITRPLMIIESDLEKKSCCDGQP
jgi:hypothetical protein